MFTTLIRHQQLADLLHHPELVLLDCRYDRTLPGLGVESWEAGHLPGALYAKLDYHLSGVPDPTSGALTLPDAQRLAVVFGAWGIDARSQVVVYDDDLCHASRAWALLRWLGHANVAVLDGGLAAWREGGGVLETTRTRARACRFPIRPALTELVADADTALRAGRRLIYAGQPAAGAFICRPWRDNCEASHPVLQDAASLRAAWQPLLASVRVTDCVHLSSHGVGACVNLLAMEVAGLAGSGLCLSGGMPVAALPHEIPV